MPLLAERLGEAGFHTAAYTEDALLAGVFGFWFGFDRFTERSYRHEDRGRGTFEDGIEYLRANRDRRFFLFLHTYKTHEPYVASRAYASLFSDPAHWKRDGMGAIPQKHRDRTNAYDRTIREADDLVGEFLRELSLLGLAERTLVVLLSDHGEAFGEHGLIGHSFSSQQEVMRVPVVFRGPGVPEGLRIDTPTSLVDVAPTILELLGLEPLRVTQGVSLVPAFRGKALGGERPLYFSWLGDQAIGVRYGRWKYRSVGQRRALFDLETDPQEMRSVVQSDQQQPRWERLLSNHRKASAEIRAGFGRAAQDRAAPAISEQTEKSLRALGYIE
jgi:arylsulfatase A-like enzyme